jgi:hypothetical protein
MKPRLEDLVGVQDREEGGYAIRCVYESDPGDVNWDKKAQSWKVVPDDAMPTIGLKILKQECDINTFKSYDEDAVIQDVIDEMYKGAHELRQVEYQKPKNDKDDSGRRYMDIVSTMISSCSKIAMATRRGAGNFIITSPTVVKILEEHGNVYKDGFLNHTVQVYEWDDERLETRAICGYKGPGASDCGFVVVHLGNAYQIIDIEGSHRYYVVVENIV